MFDRLTIQGVCFAVFGALLVVITVIQAIHSIKNLKDAWGSGGFLVAVFVNALILAVLATLSCQAFLSAKKAAKSTPQTSGKNYTVAVSYTLVEDGDIGSDWGFSAKIGDTQLTSQRNTVFLQPGCTIATVKITEYDPSRNDVGSCFWLVDINGEPQQLEKTITVRENGGKLLGKSTKWKVKLVITPQLGSS